jgi:beta-ureidopropionase
VRALAFNGAEVVYRPSEAVPMTQMGMEPGGTWLLQNWARAHFNNVYMICPNIGSVYVHPQMEYPAQTFPGARYIPLPKPSTRQTEQVRRLWPPSGEE